MMQLLRRANPGYRRRITQFHRSSPIGVICVVSAQNCFFED
jgi:hypothetical protein